MVNLWLYLSKLPLPCVSRQEGKKGADVGEGIHMRGADQTLDLYMSLLVTKYATWHVQTRRQIHRAPWLHRILFALLICWKSAKCVIVLVAFKGLITCKTDQCQGLQGLHPPSFVSELTPEEDRHVTAGCKQIMMYSLVNHTCSEVVAKTPAVTSLVASAFSFYPGSAGFATWLLGTYSWCKVDGKLSKNVTSACYLKKRGTCEHGLQNSSSNTSFGEVHLPHLVALEVVE